MDDIGLADRSAIEEVGAGSVSDVPHVEKLRIELGDLKEETIRLYVKIDRKETIQLF